MTTPYVTDELRRAPITETRSDVLRRENPKLATALSKGSMSHEVAMVTGKYAYHKPVKHTFPIGAILNVVDIGLNEETYIEKGFIGRLVKSPYIPWWQDDNDCDIIGVRIRWSEFHYLNRLKEVPNYYDEDNVPCKTATELGKAVDEDDYFYSAAEYEKSFVLCDDLCVNWDSVLSSVCQDDRLKLSAFLRVIGAM
jgi:hypothetical protein